MKKTLLTIVILFTALNFFTSCGNYTNDAIGRTYEFVGNEILSNCQECDEKWFITIENENTASIYSSPSISSSLKSCETKVEYEFNSERGAIIIKQMQNPSINNNCKGIFIDTWVFDGNGIKGKGFYKNSNCGFVRLDNDSNAPAEDNSVQTSNNKISFSEAESFMQERCNTTNQTLMKSKTVNFNGTNLYMFLSVAENGYVCISSISENALEVLASDCGTSDVKIQDWNALN